MPGTKRSQSGYSLVEIIISLFIIGQVLAIYAIAVNLIVLDRSVKHQELATNIATSEIEDLRNLPYDFLPGSGAFTHPLLDQLPNGQAAITVSDYNTKTKLITATVTWQESPQTSVHTATLTTLITPNGL